VTFKETGLAPVIYQATESIHPWGRSVPTLTCAPLNVCSVHLEPGEEIRDIAAGDPVRWQIATVTSGEPPTPHLIVKPTELDLATNLFITTQRRTYALDLRSPSPAEAKKPGFRIDRSLLLLPG
jgi:type IV secretory pathway VirB9-like protein